MNVENKGEGIKLSMSMVSLNMRTEFSDWKCQTDLKNIVNCYSQEKYSKWF